MNNNLSYIAERKKAEQALLQSEQKYRELANSLPTCIFEADLNGRIIFANRTAFEWFGYSEADLLEGENVIQMLAEADRQRAGENLRRVLSVGEASLGEYTALRKDGRTFPALVTTRAMVKDGQPIGFLGIVIDITERKRSEQALRRERDRIQNYLDIAEVMLLVLDVEGKIVLINRKGARILGYEERELIGKNWFEGFLRHQDSGRVRNVFDEIIAGRIEQQEYYENYILTKTGQERCLAWHNAIVTDEDGRILGTLSSGEDITERKQAEESLHQSMTQLRTTLKAAINSLASAIEMRDPYTTGHQERVTKLACAIAREMGLSEDQIECIQIAGIIHDIGKIYVPADILSKPGKLNEFEFLIIKTHSQVGSKILSKIEFPWPIADIVHQHHERVNGSGYPQRLTGKDILLEAKILAVADVVEAMSSHRPYRPALGIPVALEEISRNKGVLYDPEVADACLKLFAGNKFKFE